MRPPFRPRGAPRSAIHRPTHRIAIGWSGRSRRVGAAFTGRFIKRTSDWLYRPMLDDQHGREADDGDHDDNPDDGHQPSVRPLFDGRKGSIPPPRARFAFGHAQRVRAAAVDPAPSRVVGTGGAPAFPLGPPSVANSPPVRRRANPRCRSSRQRRAAGRRVIAIVGPPRSRALLAGFARRRRITRASDTGRSLFGSTTALDIGRACEPSLSIALQNQ